jgi:hypothetical protein
LTLSTVNQTLDTPVLSEADAASVTVPPTVAPFVGLVTVTDGGVESTAAAVAFVSA